ncbi:hypothetical protein Q4F19_14545 [Sphingomonas sp. BIUV-7]|uniref:Uncharacterized protein n=1 Tax=Sphingomonas natans TaxID=3063330 RepID=A0ABT8YB94_9SPHN|nr:hypothetical protein [Sphingomonas sp. BIUV-7]MDO6415606.1 hypothetical protein [Sphingomonas sp. BIUV-7]
MRNGYHERTTDFGIRLSGAALCGIAYWALRSLAHMHLTASPGWPAFALAALGFLCASLGSAFVMLGRHILDDVEISARWASSSTRAQRDAVSCKPHDPGDDRFGARDPVQARAASQMAVGGRAEESAGAILPASVN